MNYLRALLALTVMLAGLGAASAAHQPTQSAHQQTIDFWTHERVSQAVPRDFLRDSSGRFVPAMKPDNPGKPGDGNGGDSGVTGASWTAGGAVADTTGKVLFAMGGSYFVCSASVVTDTANGRSVILTAAHCAYDESGGAFATNWTFIPNYDAAPAPLSSSSNAYCDDTLWGCWTATALVAHQGYTTAGGFNDQAVVHDFAFAVTGAGGHSGTSLVEDVVGSQAIVFDANAGTTVVDAFGYPAAQKYKGNDLVYCEGPTAFDPNMNNATYRIACNMTGGSSGGPWMKAFDSASGTGTLTSVNSYGYSGDKSMYGPIFNSDTQDLFNAALSTANNTIVP